jgi:hypothetical protein
LLAPATVVFFDHAWVDIGTKSSLEEVLSEITGIHDFEFYEEACVAQKMSWASNRQTTRVEDKAYCLMGLFGVNMPLLYGEGQTSFLRLQLEIIKLCDDESIFAWSSESEAGGLLAKSPRAFEGSGRVRPISNDASIQAYFWKERHHFTMTNKGLHISFFLIPSLELLDEMKGGLPSGSSQVFVAPLCCSWGEDNTCPAIILWRVQDNFELNFQRIPDQALLKLNMQKVMIQCQKSLWSASMSQKFVYVRQQNLSTPVPTTQMCTIDISIASLSQNGFELAWKYPQSTGTHFGAQAPYWGLTGTRIRFTMHDINGSCAELCFIKRSTDERILLFLGGSNDKPWVIIVTNQPQDSVLDPDEAISSSEAAFLWRVRTFFPERLGSTVANTRGSSFRRPESREYQERSGGVDRMSQCLHNGMSLSAALRPARGSAGPESHFFWEHQPVWEHQPSWEHHPDTIRPADYVVALTVDPAGAIRWPAPSWVEALANRITQSFVTQIVPYGKPARSTEDLSGSVQQWQAMNRRQLRADDKVRQAVAASRPSGRILEESQQTSPTVSMALVKRRNSTDRVLMHVGGWESPQLKKQRLETAIGGDQIDDILAHFPAGELDNPSSDLACQEPSDCSFEHSSRQKYLVTQRP